MDENGLLIWFEEIDGRVNELLYPNRTHDHGSWTDLFTNMETALENIFRPSQPVLRNWNDTMSRERQALQDDHAGKLQMAQDDLIAIFRRAHHLLKSGRIRGFADGVRAETIAQCLDQADVLASGGYVVAAMALAGGALETHLHNLCERFSLSWPGEGSISKYNGALGQARNQGTQSLVTASDSNLIDSWGKDRNDAAHHPTTFNKTKQAVQLAIEGIRQFLARSQ